MPDLREGTLERRGPHHAQGARRNRRAQQLERRLRQLQQGAKNWLSVRRSCKKPPNYYAYIRRNTIRGASADAIWPCDYINASTDRISRTNPCLAGRLS